MTADRGEIGRSCVVVLDGNRHVGMRRLLSIENLYGRATPIEFKDGTDAQVVADALQAAGHLAHWEVSPFGRFVLAPQTPEEAS